MSDKSHDRFQLERLAFFSDAVFAIAITLLVIEVRLPPIAVVTDQTLAQALVDLLPQYAGFVISFFVIGRFWIGHHTAFGHLHACDDKLVWRNLLFLLTIAAMPFPTAIISSYANTRVGVGVYAAWLAFAGWRNLSMMRYALRNPALIRGGDDPAGRTLQIRRAWLPIVIGVTGFALGMIQPYLALIPLMSSPIILRGFDFWHKRRRH